MHSCYVGYCLNFLYNTHIWLFWPIFLEQKDDEVEVYRQRFAGSQAERADREAAAIVSAKVKAVSISGKLDTFRLWKIH